MSNSTVLVSNFSFFFFLDHLIHLWVMIMKGYALQYLFMSCIFGNFVQTKERFSQFISVWLNNKKPFPT